MKLHNIRTDYQQHELTDCPADDPLRLFDSWLSEAIRQQVSEPTAMTLATATSDGKPSARIVLLKAYSATGFQFFTNYNSRKGRELAENNQAALLFFWPELERQVRVEGRVTKAPAADSDFYFESRPYESRISAVVSPQSQPVESRAALEQRWETGKEVIAHAPLHRPDYWGGYSLQPQLFEFWQGRPNRLHDRIVFRFENEKWTISRLAP